MTSQVTSKNGTAIAFDRVGTGPVLILVVGLLDDRHTADPLAELLAPAFTVYTYDRRGRGDSGDTAPYRVEREIEDLAALIDAAGGTAMVYGHSSGAVLAYEGAARGLPITRLAGYEPPWTLTPRQDSLDMTTQVASLLAQGR